MTSPFVPSANTYARLPETFHTAVQPTPVRNPGSIAFNEELATELGIDLSWLRSPAGLAVFSGNQRLEGTEPIATAYSGHQFGGFSPLLGDGRAILLGELSGKEVQLKGAGPTPFSRRGDGRSALGPVIREYLLSEAMHALGVPTTRALAAVSTGEMVLREEPLPGGILTRVAKSHLRIGTVQYFAAQRDREGLKTLVDYANQRLFPNSRGALDLLREVIAGQAKLVAQWMSFGFIHGVMNTDNMSLSGETIDYGPCAFLDTFNPQKKFSAIDQQGRYAYQNQPGIAQWNLTRLAEALLPLIDENQERAVELAKAELEAFPEIFKAAQLALFSQKIGLPGKVDWPFMQDFLDLLERQEVDFTNAFRKLAGPVDQFLALFEEEDEIKQWLHRRAAFGEPEVSVMQKMNPAYIPRNHRVEEAIQAAYRDDFQPFKKLHKTLKSPYNEQFSDDDYTRPPAPHEEVQATFCGT